MRNFRITHKVPFLQRMAHGLYLHEQITVVYLVVTSVLPLFNTGRIAGWEKIVLFHWGIVALIFAVSKLPADLFKGAKVLRGWYLFFIFPAFFKELTQLSQCVFPYYLEPLLIRSEVVALAFYRDFLSWIPQTPWLTELMAFSYLSYFFIIFGVGIYLHRKIGEVESNFYLFKLFATFLICYTLFILIPVRGPHHAMANVDPTRLDGYLFQSLVLFMQSKGSTVGAAFPSSHVAVTWICAFALRQFAKRAYYILLPLLILLTISVFYLRYHYFLDAIFGYFLAIWLQRRYILMSENVKLRFIETELATKPVLKQQFELDDRG